MEYRYRLLNGPHLKLQRLLISADPNKHAWTTIKMYPLSYKVEALKELHDISVQLDLSFYSPVTLNEMRDAFLKGGDSIEA